MRIHRETKWISQSVRINLLTKSIGVFAFRDPASLSASRRTFSSVRVVRRNIPRIRETDDAAVQMVTDLRPRSAPFTGIAECHVQHPVHPKFHVATIVHPVDEGRALKQDHFGAAIYRIVWLDRKARAPIDRPFLIIEEAPVVSAIVRIK